MIIIYRINDDNVKSVDDLTYFYYSILTANAYLDGEIRIYTTFNYYDFFAHLPFNFYPDYRDEKTFIKEVIESLDDDHIYLYKGLSLRYDEQYDKAIDVFKLAIDRNPKGQKNYTELGNTFYFQEKYKSLS